MEMRAEIIKLQRRLAVTTFFVTHDQVEALSMGTSRGGDAARADPAGRDADRAL
jgi:multiple sugar transport system ATP-binding protein